MGGPLMMMNYGAVFSSATSSAGANPQLQFFENFPGKLGTGVASYSMNTLSIHAVNIPLSISFNNVVMLGSFGALNRTHSVQFGLYSLNGSTLSLANSASGSQGNFNGVSWFSMVTSASQNISPGAWYFAVNVSTSGGVGAMYGNTSINPGNAVPGGFVMGRMTASTGALPSSIATSNLDITGSDATRRYYIIITA